MTEYIYCQPNKSVFRIQHIETTDCLGPHHYVVWDAWVDELQGELENATHAIAEWRRYWETQLQKFIDVDGPPAKAEKE